MKNSKLKKYFLDSDGDGHWYLVEYNKKEDWSQWVNLPGEDENRWETPKFAERIDGHLCNIIFENPKQI